MAEDRPFPPSARRIALARRAGLSPTSPLLVGAVTCGAAALVLAMIAGTVGARLRAMIAAACAGTDRVDSSPDGALLEGTPLANSHSLVGAIGDLVVPILAALAIAAVAAQVAQTRTLWLPRRKIDDAPALEAGPIARTRSASFELLAGGVIGATALGWLWWAAPRLAVLPELVLAGGVDAATSDTASVLGATGALTLSALAALAIAWLALGVLDALFRHLAHARALRMTTRERREDERLSAADPRWRDLRAKLAREPAARSLLADATLVLLGDDAAVAIAFDPIRRPVPARTATGRGVRAAQLLALARRDRLAIHRDASLVAALGATTGPVPEAHWARLAEIVAATSR
jgi:flagellar biosynthesis protein FlhB